MSNSIDVITIGRAGVDLYGSQIGGRLEDMGSFEKYIGGSPTNIACGASRLGLKTALISRVGDEHMGRFILEQLAREGVSTQGVITDPERLTALVILGIRDDEQFPLVFYRENCADKARSIADQEVKLKEAKLRDILTVIVIDTDARPGPGENGGGAWWDVAVPQVGGSVRLEKARENYNNNAAKQRPFD